MPAKRMKKKPEPKEAKPAGPSLLDQVMGMFKKKAPEPRPARPRYDDSIPPP